ncbi:MAG: DUF3311 domain-containing protein, partial [Gammaproteobacteria bacterium]
MSRWRRTCWHGVLLIPFIGILWVPFYNRIDPALFGIPFFYWFQFVWIVVSGACTAL